VYMPNTRWRFSSRENPSQTIVVEDPQSAQILSALLGNLAPGGWLLQEEVVPAAKQEPEPSRAAPALPQRPAALETRPPAPPVFPARPPLPQAAEEVSKSADSGSGKKRGSLFVRDGQSKSQVHRPIEPVAAEPSRLIPEIPVAPEIPESVIMEERSAILKKQSEQDAAIQCPAPVSKPHIPRKHRRFNLEFKVILIAEGRTFRSFTDNISIGGMALKHKIPATMLNKSCRIIISRSDSLENIEFSCRIHGGPEDAKRLEFVDCDPATVSNLQRWIESGASRVPPRAA
jgi:hypothetical protein